MGQARNWTREEETLLAENWGHMSVPGLCKKLNRSENAIMVRVGRLGLPPYLEAGKWPEWVIIGAETGNRKGKVKPKPEWIWDIVRECDARKVPVFMKNSLVPIIGEEAMRRHFPFSKDV